MASISFQSGTMSYRFQIICLVGVLGLFAAAAWFTYNAVHLSNQNTTALYKSVTSSSRPATSSITTFQQCAAAGNPVQQSYPEVCVTTSGQRFIDQ